MKNWLRGHGRDLIYSGIAASIFLIILYFFWVRPTHQLNDAAIRLTAKEFLELKNSIRSGLAQALGGAVLLIGLFFSWRSIRATERNLEIAQDSTSRSLALSQEGQITERFTHAINLLGSESIASRVGGIYALERIAQDSRRDHWPVVEILSAYIRENSPCKQSEIATPTDVDKMLAMVKEPAADIRSSLTVLGRRTSSFDVEGRYVNLLRTDLRRSVLDGAHLENANISHSHFEWSALRRTHFDKAFLFGSYFQRAFADLASFKDASLGQAHFEGAFLEETNLEGADLSGVHFEGAILRAAKLQRANLAESHWNGALTVETDLRGVNLTKAQGLTQAQIDSAKTDELTLLPDYLKK